MKLSIITPWYEGAKYMPAYETMILENYRNLNPGQSLEVILVNDSPWMQIVPEALNPYTEAGPIGQLSVRILVNAQNSGIQASRVNGLHAAEGDYVLFLDQDDALAETAARDFLCAAAAENDALRGALVSRVSEQDDVIAAQMYVCNAMLGQRDGSYAVWYRRDWHKKQIGNLSAYLNVGTQIISPGQVMLPRALVPEAYLENILTQNGADDVFLWLLLLSDGTEVCYIDKPLYYHNYTGKNISADTSATDASCFAFLDIMETQSLMPASRVRRMRRMLQYKDTFRREGMKGKLLSSLKNPDLLLSNLIFKLRTRTPYGYNR